MATASFHKFTLLPPEIQQQIWTLAAESAPGAHFFTYNDIDVHDESEIARRPSRFIRRTTRCGPYLALQVPDDDRSIIRPAKHKKHKDDFLLGTHLDKSGVTRDVVVRSETDLIILRPTKVGGDVFWDRVRDDCPPGIMHLALEYDPSWPRIGQGHPPDSESGRAACERLAELASVLCYWPRLVWFIDYSLRRRPDAGGYLDDCRNQFWCAAGRFVQVWEDDEDWVTGPGDGVHKLVVSLKEEREARLRLEEDLQDMEIVVHNGIKIPLDPDHPYERHMGPGPQNAILGVLAFEPW